MKIRSISSAQQQMGLHSFVMAMIFTMIVGLAAGPFVEAAPNAMAPTEADVTVGAEASGLLETETASFGNSRWRYVRCNSTGRRKNTCNTWGRNPVTLWRVHSRSSCVRRRDWNTSRNGRYVWVDNGCQATFRVSW